MFTNRGFIGGFKSFRNVLSNVFFKKVFADEGGEQKPAPAVNFEQLIAQARREEKEKLYPRLQKAEEELKTANTSLNKVLLENAALKEEVQKLQASQTGGLSKEAAAKLTKQVETLTAENEQLKKDALDEAKIREKVESEYEIKLYAEQKKAEAKDSVLSVLLSEITGETKEAIDAAVDAAKEKTLQTKKDLGLVDDKGNPVNPKDSKKKEDKPASKKAPAANPAANTSTDTYDAEYIRNLDPASDEYKEFRKKIGLK